MNSRYNRRIGSHLASLLLALPLAAGCGDASVQPSVSILDKTTKALTIGSFLEISGTYGGSCVARSGSWSVGVNGFSQLSNSPLSVVRNDAGCALTATSVHVGAMSSSTTYVANGVIPLGASFLGSAVPFSTAAGGMASFYGNLRIQPDLSFSSDFVINLLYSDDPNVVSASAVADYAVQSASATAGAVAAPDYTIDVTGISFQVDSAKIAQSASGSAALTFVNVTGQSFVVSPADLGSAPTYAAVAGEFQAGAPQALVGPNPSVAAAAFGLSQLDLSTPQVRTLIVANTENGTSSYEVFRITFSAP
jgi:hypothetical protein